jgi:hypothetical protein
MLCVAADVKEKLLGSEEVDEVERFLSSLGGAL